MNGEQKGKVCSELNYHRNIWSGYKELGFMEVTKARSLRAQTFFFTLSKLKPRLNQDKKKNTDS